MSAIYTYGQEGSSMFVDAGVNIQVFCDYESRTLRIQTNSMPAPWLPHWVERTFSTEEEWYNSPYAARVTNERVDEGILWFWHDIKQESTPQ